jgi:hypothetical protein
VVEVDALGLEVTQDEIIELSNYTIMSATW